MKAWIKTALSLGLVFLLTGSTACGDLLSSSTQSSTKDSSVESSTVIDGETSLDSASKDSVSAEDSSEEELDSSGNEDSASDSSSASSGSDGLQADIDTALEKLLTDTKTFTLNVSYERRLRVLTEVELQKTNGSMTISKTVDGFNAIIDLTTEYIDTKNEIEETREIDAYLIDGFAYSYDAEKKVYVKEYASLEDVLTQYGLSMEQVENIVEEAAAILGDEETDTSSMLGQIVREFGEIKQTSDSVSLTFDAESDVDAVIEYIYFLDKTMRIKDLIDAYLVQYNPVIDTDFILEQLGRLGKTTIAEAVESADSILQNAFGTNLQAVKDETVVIPAVRDGLLEQMSEEKYQELVELDFSEFVQTNGEITLDELAQSYTEDETVTFKSFFAELTEKLETYTIADLGEEAVGLLTLLQTLTCEDLSGGYTMAFDGQELVECSVEYNLSFGVSTNKETVSYNVTLSDFSAEERAISLPEGATVESTCLKCGKTGDIPYDEGYHMFLCGDCNEE